MERRSATYPAFFWDRLSLYPVCYRTYTLGKIGLSLGYLWFCLDFLRIVLARIGPARALIPPSFYPNAFWAQADALPLAHFLHAATQPAVLFSLFALAPFVTALFLSGRWPLLAGLSMAGTMLLATASAWMFQSMADAWLFWALLLYAFSPDPAALRNAFDRSAWRSNPLFKSRYAAAVTLLSFGVYFCAGFAKIAVAPAAWLHGTALQRLAYDPAMYDWVRGTPVPLSIAWVLCWVTLGQRLIVPFFFYFPKGPWRLLSWLILGSMHVGYSLVMRVSLFPVVGLSTLCFVLPTDLFRRGKISEEKTDPAAPANRLQLLVYACFLSLLIAAPAWQEACTYRRIPNKIPPPLYGFFFPMRWEMFANGGLHSKATWKYGITNSQGQSVNLTDRPKSLLPPIWRTRFYMEEIASESRYPLLMPPFAKFPNRPPPIPDEGPLFRRHPVLFSYLREAERLYLQQNPHDFILFRKVTYDDGLHSFP